MLTPEQRYYQVIRDLSEQTSPHKKQRWTTELRQALADDRNELASTLREWAQKFRENSKTSLRPEVDINYARCLDFVVYDILGIPAPREKG